MEKNTAQGAPPWSIEEVATYPRPGMAYPDALAFSPDDRLITYLWSPRGDLTRQLYAFDPETGEKSLLLALFGLIAFFFLWGYYVFFELIWNGQSPGKRWVGLRVIQIDGTPITLTESLIRNLVRLVDFLPAYYGVGVVAMFVNQQARRLGDLAAGTLVVRDRESVTLASLAATAPREARPAPASAAEWPIERLTSEEIELAEDFLRRRDQIAGRTAVARRIARALLVRMEVPVDDQAISLSAERIIERIVQASRDRPS